MSHIGLLRHGEVAGGTRFRGRLDDPLTPHGWRQMRDALAGDGPWQAVVSSPLQRCAAFARDWAEERDLPLVLDGRLAEIDFGAWEGHTVAEIHAREPEALGRFWSDPVNHPPPGGESLAVFSRRVLSAWEEIQADGRDTLVVTHGGVIRVLLCRLRGLELSAAPGLEVGHGALVRVENGRLLEAAPA